MPSHTDEQHIGSSRIDRRSLLSVLGGSTLAGTGLVSQTDTVTAHEDEGRHWINGAQLDCLIEEDEPDFDLIYDYLKQWENQLVTLENPAWDGNIRIRIGDVLRVPNESVQDTWAYYYGEGNGFEELGDTRKIMLCGSWDYEESHVWNNHNHIGRVNDARVPDESSAYKYWFHEVAHAHTLCHREGDYLMDGSQLYDLSMESAETSRWYDVYDVYQQPCTHGDPDTFARGPSRSEIDDATPPDTFEQTTVVTSRPCHNPTTDPLEAIVAGGNERPGPLLQSDRQCGT